jgi:hypothetical protein
MKVGEYHHKLLEKYVEAFPKLDEMALFDCGIASPELELASGKADQYDRKIWRAKFVKTGQNALAPLYQQLPAPFPPLYELLVLSYRWAEVNLQSYRLIANPPGEDLIGLLRNIMRDEGLRIALISSGFIQFGKGPDVDYDPVCFDIRSRNKAGDYRIVKIDHEEILCNNRIKIMNELAPSFEQLVLNTVQRAESPRTV